MACEECGAGDLHYLLCSHNRHAVKGDAGKPDLAKLIWLPPGPAMEICEAFVYGAKKYSPLNYRKGFKRTRLLGAALRHLFAYAAGQDKDPSGHSNLAHAGASIMMLMQNIADGAGEDDREKGLEELWREET